MRYRGAGFLFLIGCWIALSFWASILYAAWIVLCCGLALAGTFGKSAYGGGHFTLPITLQALAALLWCGGCMVFLNWDYLLYRNHFAPDPTFWLLLHRKVVFSIATGLLGALLIDIALVRIADAMHGAPAPAMPRRPQPRPTEPPRPEPPTEPKKEPPKVRKPKPPQAPPAPPVETVAPEPEKPLEEEPAEEPDPYRDALALFDISPPYTLLELTMRRNQLLKGVQLDPDGSAAMTRRVNDAFMILRKRL